MQTFLRKGWAGVPLRSPSLFNTGIKSTDELFEALLLLILVVYNCSIAVELSKKRMNENPFDQKSSESEDLIDCIPWHQSWHQRVRIRTNIYEQVWTTDTIQTSIEGDLSQHLPKGANFLASQPTAETLEVILRA